MPRSVNRSLNTNWPANDIRLIIISIVLCCLLLGSPYQDFVNCQAANKHECTTNFSSTCIWSVRALINEWLFNVLLVVFTPVLTPHIQGSFCVFHWCWQLGKGEARTVCVDEDLCTWVKEMILREIFLGTAINVIKLGLNRLPISFSKLSIYIPHFFTRALHSFMENLTHRHLSPCCCQYISDLEWRRVPGWSWAGLWVLCIQAISQGFLHRWGSQHDQGPSLVGA